MAKKWQNAFSASFLSQTLYSRGHNKVTSKKEKVWDDA